MPKKRLDELVLEKGFADTKSKAQAIIMSGEIWVNAQPSLKPGHTISTDALIEYRSTKSKYVSRGGEKLAGALTHFKLNVTDLTCLDLGASTGGFTDCLLQHGAKKVFTIDVGKGQLDPKIRSDPRVVPRESFHAREIEPALFEGPLDLITVDVSFISLKKVLPFIIPILKNDGTLLALIKPQFEATKKDIPKGVLKDEPLRQAIIKDIQNFTTEHLKLEVLGIFDSTLKGPKGNQETFMLSKKIKK